MVTLAPAALAEAANCLLRPTLLRVWAWVGTMYKGRPTAFWIVSTGLRTNRFSPVTTLPIARVG